MSSCQFPRCEYLAEYCFADEPGVGRFCSLHKDDTMIPLCTCQFPRCTEAPTYAFADQPAIARCCEKHKSDDMVLAGSAGSGAAAPVYAAYGSEGPNQPSAVSIELAHKYFELKPQLDGYSEAKHKAAVHQAKVDSLRKKIGREDADIHAMSKNIEQIEHKIHQLKMHKKKERERHKKKDKEAEKEKLEEAMTQDDIELQKLLDEQAELDDPVGHYDAIEARIQDLRAQVIEEEAGPTSPLRRLEAKLQDEIRLQGWLKVFNQDMTNARKTFNQALQLQVKAARSNAMATGANIGQAISGEGGRGFGESPGERLMQIRRNQATKQSIEMAQQAGTMVRTAEQRLPEEIRTAYPAEMSRVGTMVVPDLWYGNFFRDFLVGQVGGNVGDAINEMRAREMIQRNMQELEKMVAACNEQLQLIGVVDRAMGQVQQGLKKQIANEETTILEGVIKAAGG